MKTSFLSIVLELALFPLVAPATIVTTSTDEDNGSLGGGSGISLREAVKYSGSGSTVTFSAALSGQTLRLTRGNLTVDRSLTVDASGLPQRINLSADRTGNGKSADDTYLIRLNAGVLVLDSLILTDANSGESQGCITTAGTGIFSLELNRCTLARNSGYHSGSIYQRNGILTVSNSTFSENSAIKEGSAIAAFQTGVLIKNSTFSKNTGLAISCSEGSLSLMHTTVVGSSGAAIVNSESTVSLVNSIVVGNPTPGQPNIKGHFTGSNNILTGDPRLAPLGDYGGPTQTMPPLPRSPALGSASWPPALPTDQRGFPRLDKPEIGAVEYQGTADLARFWKLDTDGDGSPYGVEQALGTVHFVADSGNPRNLTAPTFDANGHPVIRFGFTAAAATGTRWSLKRSPDLSPGSFVEIYYYNRTSEAAAAGVTYVRTSTGIAVTDTTPIPGGAFYRFEARLGP